MQDFVHLHVHTQYSLLDGQASVARLVDKAMQNGKMCIRDRYLNECTLYVTVEPCVMCAGAIAWAQTGKLVFGAEDEKRGYQKYAGSALHPKTVVVKGIMADECAALMKEFFAAKRK